MRYPSRPQKADGRCAADRKHYGGDRELSPMRLLDRSAVRLHVERDQLRDLQLREKLLPNPPETNPPTESLVFSLLAVNLSLE